jgi:hypothetical protein
MGSGEFSTNEDESLTRLERQAATGIGAVRRRSANQPPIQSARDNTSATHVTSLPFS